METNRKLLKSKRGPRKNRAQSGRRSGVTSFFNPSSPPTYWKGKELKMNIIDLPASISTAATTLDLTTAIIQGTGYASERIGNAIELVAVTIDGTLIGGQSNNVADDKYNEFRIILADGTPAMAGLLAPSVESFTSPRTNPGVKKILYDRSISLASPGPDSVGYMPPVKDIKIFIPLSGTVEFTGAGAGTQGWRSITTCFVSDSAIGPNPGFSNGKQTLFYTDN